MPKRSLPRNLVGLISPKQWNSFLRKKSIVVKNLRIILYGADKISVDERIDDAWVYVLLLHGELGQQQSRRQRNVVLSSLIQAGIVLFSYLKSQRRGHSNCLQIQV